MNWDDFDAFCHVIEQGGFTAAARMLNRPKSSLSASVSRLEAQLGSRLLERTTRKVRLTEAGAALYRDIARPFSQLREVANEAAARGGTVHGTLRIAAPYEFGAHHLADPACRLMQKYPKLKIDLDVEHARINLFERHFDLVFSVTEHSLVTPGIVARRVFTLERGLYAAPSLLAGHESVSTLEQLADLPLLAGSEDADWQFTSPQREPCAIPLTSPRMRSGNAEARFRAAVAGLGVARITASYCETAVRDGQLARVLPEYRCDPLKVFALLPSRKLLPAKVRVFLDELTGEVAGADGAPAAVQHTRLVRAPA